VHKSLEIFDKYLTSCSHLKIFAVELAICQVYFTGLCVIPVGIIHPNRALMYDFAYGQTHFC